jgi:hypothetical protein
VKATTCPPVPIRRQRRGAFSSAFFPAMCGGVLSLCAFVQAATGLQPSNRFELSVHARNAWAVAIHPDLKQLVVEEESGRIEILSLPGGEPVAAIAAGPSTKGDPGFLLKLPPLVVFIPGSNSMLVARGPNVALIDPASGTVQRPFESGIWQLRETSVSSASRFHRRNLKPLPSSPPTS